MRVTIYGKPMSANRMMSYRAIGGKGKRAFAQSYPTQEYKDFLERGLRDMDGLEWPFEPEAKIKVIINAYFSNRASDLDNVAKPSLDILQQKFDWNDKFVYEIQMYKHLVKKGEEHLVIELEVIDA